MNQVTDALLLKDTASRASIAITYGIIGLVVGTMFLNKA